MKLKDIKDMERYLAEDCYCPGEIYGPDGFFFQVYAPDDKCSVIVENDEHVLLVANLDSDSPQAIFVWRDGDDGHIIDTERVDATENNVRLLTTIAKGGELGPDDRLDEYEPGSTAMALKEVMSIADAVMVD